MTLVKWNRRKGRALFQYKSAWPIYHTTLSHHRERVNRMIFRAICSQRTFEIVACLLELHDMRLVECQTVALPALIILKVRSSPSCWRDYGLGKSNGEAALLWFGSGVRHWPFLWARSQRLCSKRMVIDSHERSNRSLENVLGSKPDQGQQR